MEVNDFRGRPLPEPGTLAGYAALIDRLGLALPLPPRLAAIARRHHPDSTSDWLMLTPRHRPGAGLLDQLEFALKWEGVDFAVLAPVFDALDARLLESYIRETPTGIYTRRAWFLFEWLTGKTIDVPDPGKVKAVDAIDSQYQAAVQLGELSIRHRVIDNVPGTPLFCPLIRRTPSIVVGAASRFDERARTFVSKTHPDLMRRAASFLLLNDTKSSFALEKERVSGAKAARWSNAVAQAGQRPLSTVEFERLQKIVIDGRSIKLGLRTEGGFVGVHDRITQEPIPDHISARHEDVRDLLQGIIAFGERAVVRQMDPVLAAAAMAFGFVYVHPFEDGNGRLHRWLIHHVLSVAKYSPPGVVFPISAAILREQQQYKAVLESYSRELLPFIEWRPTPTNNVEVKNATAAYYRYFDATAHAEFLYSCLAQTVERDLPEEVAFLEAFDRFAEGVHRILDITSRQLELLRSFLAAQNGRLSKRAREREFAFLTEDEAIEVERIYAHAFRRADQ